MRFHLIDALRGVASLWVVLFHAYKGFHIDGLAEAIPYSLVYMIFEIGDSGVPIFFVISGFVIAHSVSRDHVDGKYLAKFTARRSIRLDPPYWGSIVLYLAMAWLSSTVKSEPMDWPNFGSIATHLFYAQEILGIKHINSVYWTLCLEIQFYIIFCALVSFTQSIARYYGSAVMAVFVPVATISLLWPTRILLANIHPGLFFPHWHAFLLGAFAYMSWKKRIPANFFYLYSAIILLASILSLSVFSIAAALTAVLVHESAKSGKITSLNWRWIQFLGKISYSLYLTHLPITGASFYLIYRLTGKSLSAQLFGLVVSVLACVFFAYVFWWLFESWSIQLSKKISIHKAPEKNASEAVVHRPDENFFRDRFDRLTPGETGQPGQISSNRKAP